MGPALALLVRLQVPIGILLVVIAALVPGLPVAAQVALCAVATALGVPRPAEMQKSLSEARANAQTPSRD